MVPPPSQLIHQFYIRIAVHHSPLLKLAQTYSKLSKPEYFSQDASRAVLLTIHVSESHRQTKVKTGAPCRKQHRYLPHAALPSPTRPVDASIALVALQEPLSVSRAGSPSESIRACRYPLVTARRHGPPCRPKVELWDHGAPSRAPGAWWDFPHPWGSKRPVLANEQTGCRLWLESGHTAGSHGTRLYYPR